MMSSKNQESTGKIRKAQEKENTERTEIAPIDCTATRGYKEDS